jgi:GGDEF domain-containing protein
VYGKVNIPFTVSIGGVLTFNNEIEYDELLKLVDSQMYIAKNKGRNRIEFLDLVKNTDTFI